MQSLRTYSRKTTVPHILLYSNKVVKSNKTNKIISKIKKKKSNNETIKSLIIEGISEKSMMTTGTEINEMNVFLSNINENIAPEKLLKKLNFNAGIERLILGNESFYTTNDKLGVLLLFVNTFNNLKNANTESTKIRNLFYLINSNRKTEPEREIFNERLKKYGFKQMTNLDKPSKEFIKKILNDLNIKKLETKLFKTENINFATILAFIKLKSLTKPKTKTRLSLTGDKPRRKIVKRVNF